MNAIVVTPGAHFGEAIGFAGSTEGEVAGGEIEDPRVRVEAGIGGVAGRELGADRRIGDVEHRCAVAGGRPV